MNVYICSAARTAIGTYGGTLRDVSAANTLSPVLVYYSRRSAP